MIKVLEAIFRHFTLILLMLFVPILIGLGIGYTLPRSYQVSTDLWALQRYTVISSTGTETDLTATPASTQTNALMELLQSPAFDVSVAKTTNLKSTFKINPSDTQALNSAYIGDISKNVQVTAKGTNLYEVTYVNGDPHVATQVIQSVVTQFQKQGQQFSIIEGQRLLQSDESQLTQIQATANAAVASESAYLTAHPTATITSDPQYALLDGQRLQAQTSLQNMETTIAGLKQDIASQSTDGGTFFKVLDAPVEPDTALSRSKTLTTTGGIGAAIGLFACILYILVLVRRDHALYTVTELEKVTSSPILMQVPQISKQGKELVISGTSTN